MKRQLILTLIILALFAALIIPSFQCTSTRETTQTQEPTLPSASAPPAAATPSTEPVPELPRLQDGSVLSPGEDNTFTVGAADADSNNLVFWANNLPPGATFDTVTHTFSWTPQRGQAGIYPGVTFFVSDGELTDSESIKIIVFSANKPPVLTAVPLKTVAVGNLVTFTLQASDPDGDELVFSARNLPPGAQFSPPSFSWIPAEAGVWPAISFTVSDGKLKTTRQVIIAVTK